MTTTASNPDGPEIQIRAAVRADLLDVVRIEKASFPQPWPYNAFERFLDEPGFLVADPPTTTPGSNLTDVAILGYVVADTVPNHGRTIGHIKDIAVHPDHRRRGIGTRLLERALGVLRSTDATRVKLEVRRSNTAAKAIYSRFGFESHHTVPRYYADGEDALVFMCRLDDR